MQSISPYELDHIVLTVRDLDATVAFYRDIIGMRPEILDTGRTILRFGSRKINLHVAGSEFSPAAHRPTPGSADLCLLTHTPAKEVATFLRDRGVDIVEGPIRRAGAQGSLESVYVRDPDGNLVELGTPCSEP